MVYMFLAFAVAAIVTLLIVHSAAQHAHLSSDHDMSGPQKFHSRPVPRVGGIGILAGVLAALALLAWRQPPMAWALGKVLLCAAPTFLSGVVEDFTKNISPARRLFFTAISAGLAVWLQDCVIPHTGLVLFDWVFMIPLLAPAITVFAVVGITNAVNIIDGFNGLASMCMVMMLLALGYVAVEVHDRLIAMSCVIIIGAILGFFVWNFPTGMIFLGDGGAYFLGFILAVMAVLLIQRNPGVSPMFPLLVCIYPVFETIFSIYRKKLIRKMSPGVPDGVHLHMLVYKRLMRWTVGRSDARALTRRNSMTSPYLWTLCITSVLPAVMLWDDTPMLCVFIGLFALGYVGLYWRIVRFRVPRWLVARRR